MDRQFGSETLRTETATMQITGKPASKKSELLSGPPDHSVPNDFAAWSSSTERGLLLGAIEFNDKTGHTISSPVPRNVPVRRLPSVSGEKGSISEGFLAQRLAWNGAVTST